MQEIHSDNQNMSKKHLINQWEKKQDKTKVITKKKQIQISKKTKKKTKKQNLKIILTENRENKDKPEQPQ